jgi:MFS family permease
MNHSINRRVFISVLLGHTVVLQIITFALRPSLAYALLDLNDTPALLGIVSASFAVPALLLALPAGRLVDQLGERTALVAGGIVLIASPAVMFLGPPSVASVIASTFLLGCGHLLSVVGEQSVVANRTHGSRLDAAFGYYTFAASIGQAIGPLLLAIPGADPTSPPLQFIFSTCLVSAAFLTLLACFLPSTHIDHVGERPTMLRSAGSLLKRPDVLRALTASSIALASVDITLVYWPALGQERGLSVAAISAMLFARSIATMTSRVLLAPLARLIGRRTLMVTSIGVSALALVAIAIPLPLWALILAAVVFGFSIGVCQPITMSWLAELATPGQRGMTMSLRLAGNRIGQSVIPAVVGSIAVATGVGGVLVGTAISLGFAAWSSAAVTDSHRPPPDSELGDPVR